MKTSTVLCHYKRFLFKILSQVCVLVWFQFILFLKNKFLRMVWKKSGIRAAITISEKSSDRFTKDFFDNELWILEQISFIIF